MKRPPKATPLDPNSPHSAVYLAARREWNERYGDYIAQANNWRLTAIAALAVAAVAVAGNVWQSAQSRVQPFVVEVDKLGDALAIQRADVASPIPELANSVSGWLRRWGARAQTGLPTLPDNHLLLQVHPGSVDPLLVPECLLIEPTETESKETLDNFVEVMADLLKLSRENPQAMKDAPLTMPVRRLDDVKAAKELDISWRGAA